MVPSASARARALLLHPVPAWRKSCSFLAVLQAQVVQLPLYEYYVEGCQGMGTAHHTKIAQFPRPICSVLGQEAVLLSGEQGAFGAGETRA